MSLLHGKQIKGLSIPLDKLSGLGTASITTGSLSFGSSSSLTIADSSITSGGGLSVVNKNYVDAIATGLHIKEAVEVVSLTTITLSGEQTVDGWTLSTGDRILVNGQDGLNPTASNGIYVIGTGSWIRASDSDGSPDFEVSQGDFVFVKNGTYKSSGWVLSFTDAAIDQDIQVGVETQKWVQFSESTDIQAGSGLSLNGQNFDVNTGTGLTISGDAVTIANTGVSQGSYGDANTVSTFTVNAQGQLTSAGQVDINITSDQVSNFTASSETAIFTTGNFVDGSTIDFTVTAGDSVTAEVTTGSLTASKLNTNGQGATAGYILSANADGTFAWIDNQVGDITEITAGAGLSGGGTEGPVTLNVGQGAGIKVNADDIEVDYTQVSNQLAGAGLTSSSNTINIGEGNGIKVNADTIEVNLAANSGLITTGGLQIDSSAAGAGLTYTSGIFTIGEGNGIKVNADTIEVNLAANSGLDTTGGLQIADTAAGLGLSLTSGVFDVNVTNGVQIIGDSVGLGGTLSTDTIVNGGGFSFDLVNVNSMTLTASAITLDGLINVTTNGMIVTSTSGEGIVYQSDYTSTFVTHSLVTKGFVENFVATSGVSNITAGDGLSGGGTGSVTLTVNTGTGLTISSDTVAIANTGVSQGSYGSASSVATFTVNEQGQLTAASEITIDITSSQVNDFDTAAETAIFTDANFVDGSTVTFSVTSGDSVTAEVVLSGTNSGLDTTGGLSVGVDGTTIAIVNNQLSVIAGSAQPEYSQRNLTPLTASNVDGQPTGLTLSFTPNDYSRVNVYINGQLQFLGNGASSSVDCYFTSDSGATARLLTALATGDELYWNSVSSGYTIDGTDKVDIIYEK